MKLLDCCKSISDGDWIESEDQSSSGIRLIQTGNIGVTQYLDKQERAKYISAETFNRLKCSPVVGGDVLVSRLPDPIGRACIVPYDIGPAITAVDCSIIRVNTDIVDPKYLVYFTDSDSYKSQIASYSTGTTRKRISRKNLEKISISVPSKDKQIQIIDNLDKINFLINSLWNCLLLFDDLIRSRFTEMFGDPITNPKRWGVFSVDDLKSDEKNSIKAGPFGSALKKEYYESIGYKIYGQEQVIRNNASYGDYYIGSDKYKELENCKVQPGDVLISLVGSYGKSLVIPESFEPGIINPRLMKITFDKTKIEPSYFQYLFQTDSMRKIVSENTHGGTMDILNVGIVKKLRIPLPPIHKQKEFLSFKAETDKSKFVVKFRSVHR